MLISILNSIGIPLSIQPPTTIVISARKSNKKEDQFTHKTKAKKQQTSV